jgi:hypothetical protein
MYQIGCEHGVAHWRASHTRDTGHKTRIKTHREFADILWTRDFIIGCFGEEAWQMTADYTDHASALKAYDSGLMTLAEIEEMRAMVYADSQAQKDHA